MTSNSSRPSRRIWCQTSKGLASLGHVSPDGSKFKADTSKHKAMNYKRLKEKEAELVKEIEDKNLSTPVNNPQFFHPVPEGIGIDS